MGKSAVAEGFDCFVTSVSSVLVAASVTLLLVSKQQNVLPVKIRVNYMLYSYCPIRFNPFYDIFEA